MDHINSPVPGDQWNWISLKKRVSEKVYIHIWRRYDAIVKYRVIPVTSATVVISGAEITAGSDLKSNAINGRVIPTKLAITIMTPRARDTVRAISI